MKKIRILFLSFILISAILLGARMIFSGDFYYLYDQARDYLLVNNVVDNHNLILIGNRSGLGGFFHGPLWIYMLAPVYILTKGNPFGLTYFFVGLQIITVIGAYFIGSKLYGIKSGLVISLLTALSPATWGYVTNTVSVNMEPLVYFGLFYFLIKFFRGDKKSFIFVTFLTGFALQFETASSLVLFPTILVFFILNKIAIKDLKIISLSALSFVLSIATFIMFDLRHKFLMTSAILRAFGGGQKEAGYLYLKDRFINHLGGLMGVYKDPLFSQDLLSVIFLTVIIIFGFVLILRTKKNKYKKEFIFLLLFPAVFFGFFMLYPYPVWPEYVFGLIVPVVLMFYLAMQVVWKNKFGKVLIILFFAITFFHVCISLQNQYLNKYKPLDSAGSYINQKAVVEWVYKDAGKGKFGYFVYTPEIFTHGMDYLFAWYGKSYTNSIFENKKNSTTYLILYPHLANDEGAYTFWKTNTLRTKGKVILTKKFFGGITVEKLLIENGEPDVDPNYHQGLIFR